MKKIKFCIVLWGMLLGILWRGLSVQAGDIYTSPYVSFAPDGLAWTTDAGNRAVVWYAEDGSDDIRTGVTGTLRALQTGEHYYKVRKTGAIPISEWRVALSRVNCCHSAYPSYDHFHGVRYSRGPCFQKHFSAWRPVCADCKELIIHCNFYMSRAAAKSLDYLQMGKGMAYYYLCPFDNNLEQGADTEWHTCREISANCYRVVYDANGGGDSCGGYMAPSFHMYGNATSYEGREVTPQTHLNLNTYTRIGWEFAGWNTESDGSGAYYADGAEILNLCAGDYYEDEEAGSVRLYAVWRPSESVLEIDPAGGSYEGREGLTRVRGEYGTSYTIDSRKLSAPAGCLVKFDLGGGEMLEPVRGKQHFVEWRQEAPFAGQLKESQYRFCGEDGNVDRITAVYERDAIRLPDAGKENLSFGGWYYDKQFQRPAGKAGTELVPVTDMTLYAQWVELVLTAEDNYRGNGGRGAVDLSWSQPDGQKKIYKLYQSREGESWRQILDAHDMQESVSFERQYEYTHEANALRVPYAGFYRIGAWGAQGGNYGEFSGGPGGTAAGTFWLERGELVNYCVAGQNGFNGGGKGEIYANGGGYSVASLGMDDILLMAGGGGGAGDSGDGYPGGSSQSLVLEGHEGEDGSSGGGGGYLGGHAGEKLVHHHEAGVCNHVHQGNPSKSGGCYTIPVKCGQQLEHKYSGSKKWYWGGGNEEYCPNCGADASLGESCIGHETDYYDHICPVHGKQANNTKKKSPSVCNVVAGYAVSCGKTEDYICGYPYDGYVISAKPSYGGSNYVNTVRARSYETKEGGRIGNGRITIVSEDIGYHIDTSLNAVTAEDMEAPDAVSPDSIVKTPVDEETLKLCWQEPQDHGTTYYHKVESFAEGSSEMLSVSNVTINTLVSGTAGYWYCLDTNPYTEVNERNGSYLSRAKLVVTLLQEEQYLHVLAVDVAGNRSGVVHIPLGSKSGGSTKVRWPIVTEQLILQSGENVYPAKEENTYYVRSDGYTPLAVEYCAYMQGPATGDYQLNYAILESEGKEGGRIKSSIYVPVCDVNEGIRELPAGRLRFSAGGEGYLTGGNYAKAVRSQNCRKLAVIQELLPDRDAHGQTICLIPIAGADDGPQVVYSDYQADCGHGIWLIGDGEAPQISGMEVLETRSLLDRRQEHILLRVQARDELSGVRELYLEIENLDNGCLERYVPDDEGMIVVDICEDEPIFSGDFRVTAYASDNVGNENSIVCSTLEFDLNAKIERVLEPHEPQFKRGESGCLRIVSRGYADKVEIEFPPEFVAENPELNQVYVYKEDPMYKQEESCEFMIPLYVPERREYVITVRAYKGDRMLEAHPALAVLGVEGSVLSELRTRLR